MLDHNSCPVPNPDVVGRLVGDEAVLVIAGKGEVKVLNEIGARIWSLIDGTRTVGDIAGLICSEYDVEPAQAEADAIEFIEQLVGKGILTLR